MKQTRKLWPDKKLLLVCRAGLGDFFLRTQLVDQVFEINKGDQKTYSRALSEIAKEDIHYLMAPHQSMRTLFFCARIKAKTKISFSGFGRGLVFNHLRKRDLHLPDAIRQLSLLTTVDRSTDENIQKYLATGKPFRLDEKDRLTAPPAWASMSLREKLTDANAEGARSNFYKKHDLKTDKPMVLLFPGSVWATKRWIAESYARLGAALLQNNYQVLVMGAPDEAGLAKQVTDQIHSFSGGLKAECLAGKTSIYESAILISSSALVIGNDSASTHLASVAETPLIAVFGPTILEFGYRPWSAHATIAQNKFLTCRPCGPHGHRKCPIGTHECMKSISFEEVLEKALFILR